MLFAKHESHMSEVFSIDTEDKTVSGPILAWIKKIVRNRAIAFRTQIARDEAAYFSALLRRVGAADAAARQELERSLRALVTSEPGIAGDDADLFLNKLFSEPRLASERATCAVAPADRC
jgi:hypothetical protein